MKPSDFYMKPEQRTQGEERTLPNDNYLFIITKHTENERFPGCVDMSFEVAEGHYKGSKISTRFSMIKKDGTENPIAKRIYSQICDSITGGYAINEYYEILGKQVMLEYKSVPTEKAVYHNVYLPSKSKKQVTVNNAPIVHAPSPTQLTTYEDVGEDVPF
jgi:hypothetical protein